MKWKRFVFAESHAFGERYSKPVRLDGSGAVRLAAWCFEKGSLRVEAQGSWDQVNWSVIETWNALWGVAIFGETKTEAPWLRARVAGQPFRLLFAVALLEQETGSPEAGDEIKEDDHGR
ncbi:MAG: hypothetical protein FD180_2543 [Planctomycetota bacterium]|nr:MAG: hypothetical protein FD180_2543 [Planctomycetota bacterium]